MFQSNDPLSQIVVKFQPTMVSMQVHIANTLCYQLGVDEGNAIHAYYFSEIAEVGFPLKNDYVRYKDLIQDYGFPVIKESVDAEFNCMLVQEAVAFQYHELNIQEFTIKNLKSALQQYKSLKNSIHPSFDYFYIHVYVPEISIVADKVITLNKNFSEYCFFN